MSYIKRNKASKIWPIQRKGTKYVVVPSSNREDGIPLLILVRDVLGFVKTKKELKKILNDKNIEVNGKLVCDEKRALLLFDVLYLKSMNKYYRLEVNEKKKFCLEEISEKESVHKISKVSGKKMLKNKKLQINLQDGTNLLSDTKVKVGDSALINLKDKKIEEILPIKEKSKVLVIKGKHIGKKGEILKIDGEEILLKTETEEIKIKEEEIIVLK